MVHAVKQDEGLQDFAKIRLIYEPRHQAVFLAACAMGNRPHGRLTGWNLRR
jgi:hypothetical protein